ncbi:hypothetical protein [Candidatus Avelusimicrobium luingense]|uniref:hypothetical protein n=1 Tax=Candidatus Avelusimicrobium luingense TaxID=3416211 RepID=UPI003D0B7E8F
MSKTSYCLIAIMITALLFMGAVRGYQFYQKKVAQWEEERLNSPDAAFSFQRQTPVALSAPQAEPVSNPQILPADITSMAILPLNADESAAGKSVSLTTSQSVVLEDAPLPETQAIEQAQETLRSIVRDFKDEPEIKAFNQDLAKATQGQAVDLSALGGGDLGKILKDNPQIQEVVSKHMQDPNFAQTVKQILSNPQFVESVQQLQKHSAGAAKNQKQNK